MRLLASVVLAAATAGAVAAPPAGAAGPPAVRSMQNLVTLRTSRELVSAPRAHPSWSLTLQAARPITGGPTVLPVVGRSTTRDGVRWLQVMAPGRPNGRKGWIKQRGTVLSRTSWHLVVKTSSRRVLVYRRGQLVRTLSAIVGKPSTPTPHGRFFVEESVHMLPGSPGAPFALALSARSNVLQEFAGGPGQIAMHGVSNVGGTPGTAISHGCVRLSNRDISWLAWRIPPGVPVTIAS